jgi:hypothetical protein
MESADFMTHRGFAGRFGCAQHAMKMMAEIPGGSRGCPGGAQANAD